MFRTVAAAVHYLIEDASLLLFFVGLIGIGGVVFAIYLLRQGRTLFLNSTLLGAPLLAPIFVASAAMVGSPFTNMADVDTFEFVILFILVGQVFTAPMALVLSLPLRATLDDVRAVDQLTLNVCFYLASIFGLILFGIGLSVVDPARMTDDVNSGAVGLILAFGFAPALVAGWVLTLIVFDKTPEATETKTQDTSLSSVRGRNKAADKEYQRIKGKKPPKMIEYKSDD